MSRIRRFIPHARNDGTWRSSRAAAAAWASALALWAALALAPVHAADELTEALRRADAIKTSNYAEFAALLSSLESKLPQMQASDREYWRYLSGWQRVYQGDYAGAIAALQEGIATSDDSLIQFRARTTLVNVLALARHYEPALVELGNLLAQLPDVRDGGAREQAQIVAAILYNKVGQYDLAMNHADAVVQSNWAGKGACKGGQLKIEAMFRSQPQALTPLQLRSAIDACERVGEPLYANVIRLYLARWLSLENRHREAIEALTEKYADVSAMATPRVTSDFDATLALAYRETGNKLLAQRFAQRAVDTAVKNQFTEPLAQAYRVLYLLAKERGDAQAALMYHEKYTDADRGYLDDVTARQLAFQRVKHEVDALSKQNELLELQRKLSAEVVENSRLYILLLITVIGSIAALAYKIRRSQQHFKRLAQRDGLTGVFNRQRFIELTESALLQAKREHLELWFVLCDLDHFKEINDAYGHPAGDAVLRRATAVFQANTRDGDLIGRLGGEEFGILLSGCGEEVALQRCELMRQAIADIKLTDRDLNGRVSASFGVAAARTSRYEFRQLVLDADAALYDAKRRGRNRVVMYGETMAKNAVATTSIVISQFAV